MKVRGEERREEEMVLDPAYAEVIQRRLEVPLSEGPDKVTTLE